MKYRTLSVALRALALTASALLWPYALHAEPDPDFHIYLLLGQSNMEGSAVVEPPDRVPHPRVRVLQSESCYSTSAMYGQWREATPPLIRCSKEFGLGPGDTFGKAMAEAAGPDVTIGLVGAAYGGASIEYFLKNCATYNACEPPYGPIAGAPDHGTSGYKWVMDLARKAQEVGVIKGIIFHQGESNADQSAWPGRVNQYITDLRRDLGLSAEEVPFIAGELPYTGCCASHNRLVHQLADVIENGHWVSADGGLMDRGDQLHWNSAAVREMGLRYAAKMQEIAAARPKKTAVKPNTPKAPTPTTASPEVQEKTAQGSDANRSGSGAPDGLILLLLVAGVLGVAGVRLRS